MGFIESRFLGRRPDAPLFPELIPQGLGQSRAAPVTSRFTEYRRGVGVYQKLMDFHALRSTFITSMDNLTELNSAWGDELSGHVSPARSVVRDQYNKGVLLSHLKGVVDQIRFYGDDQMPRYDGPKGAPNPDAPAQIQLYFQLAKREMNKKASRKAKQTTQTETQP